MNDSPGEARAVHVCKNCGHTILRSEMKTAEIVSGVIQCPTCQHSGPLNIDIRGSEDKKPPSSVRR